LQLIVEDKQNQRIALTIGQRNPLSDRYYASGAGRSGVFTVSSSLVDALQSLPEWIRLRRLWPVFARARVETFTVAQPALPAADVFLRSGDGLWWLVEPPDGLRRLGGIAPRYDRHYGDRRRQAAGQVLWRASDRKLEGLLFKLTDTPVKAFGLLQAPDDSLRAVGLKPPLVSVSLALAAGGPRLTADFGYQTKADRMAALRGGQPNLLEVTTFARDDLLAPLAQFLDASVLPFTLALADSFLLRQDGAAPLRVYRSPQGWQTTLSPRVAPYTSVQEATNLLHDLVVYLDRLEIETVLPPVLEGTPLSAGYRYALTAWLPSADGPQKFVVQFGHVEDSRQPAAYFPADGKLLGIPGSILVTLRSMSNALGFDNR
jgi:hypothetical protein